MDVTPIKVTCGSTDNLPLFEWTFGCTECRLLLHETTTLLTSLSNSIERLTCLAHVIPSLLLKIRYE